MDREERIRQFAIHMEMFGDYVLEWGGEHFDYDKTANALDKLGYRKIVWHKIVDGTWKDVPRDTMLLFVVQYEDINTGEIIKQVIPGSIDSESNCLHLHCASYKETPNNRDTEGIIAWTELPSYEEE